MTPITWSFDVTGDHTGELLVWQDGECWEFQLTFVGEPRCPDALIRHYLRKPKTLKQLVACLTRELYS